MPIKPLKLALGGMMAMAAGIGIGRFVYTPILPVMVESLALSKSTAGIIASANFLGYFLGAVFAAMPKPSHERIWLLCALNINVAALLLTGISETLSILLLARFVSGIASAFVLVFASALVLERLTASGDAVFASVHFGGVGVGITLSALMTSYLVGVNSSWQAMWYASAGLSAIALAATALLVPDWQRPRSQPTQQQSSSKSTGLVYLVISYGLFGFGYVITATFIVTLIRETPAIAQLENSIWIVFGLAAVPSVALWTWLASRFGLLPAFAVACLVEAVGVGASVLWVSLPGLVLAAILLGGTFMGLTALGLIAARTLATDSPRRALAAMTSAFGLGQIIGPALAGYLRDVTGSFYAPTLTAVGALVLAALLVMLMAKLVPCDTR